MSTRSKEEVDITESASRLHKSLARLKGSHLGAQQRTALHNAASIALGSKTPCKLHHVRDALLSVYKEAEMKEDGDISTMREVCRFPLFQPQHDPASFFSKAESLGFPRT